MSKLTAQQFQEKHARRLKGATEDMTRGVEGVTVSPTAKAADAKIKMRAKITAAIDNGKWERGLRRVSLDEWKDKMVSKGIPRVSEGIDAAADKVVKFASELLPFQDGLKREVDGMPSVTLEDNINRMTKFVRGMAKFQRKG